MSRAEAVQSAATKPAQTSSQASLLQRKCACGGSAALAGDCADCRSRKLLGKRLQTKRRSPEPGDEFEQEADRIAASVVQMPYRKPAAQRSTLISRVQSSAPRDSTGAQAVPAIVHDVLASPGKPLDSGTRAYFEPRFGHDFGNVRVHADTKATESARLIDALAYTVGSDIVLGEARRTSSADKQRSLLAHELTHVLQQGAAPACSGNDRLFSRPSDSAEREADLTAGAALAGKPLTVRAQPVSRIQRQAAGDSPADPAPAVDASFLNRVVDFLQSFHDFRELMATMITESPYPSRLGYALRQFDQQLEGMNYYNRFGAGDVYGLLSYAHQALGIFELIIPQLAVSSASADLGSARGQLASVQNQLARLQNFDLMQAQAAKIATQYRVRAEEAQAESAVAASRRNTPEGRREAALLYIKDYVGSHWKPNLDQASVDVHATLLGHYLVHEEKLSGADIQLVLEALKEEDTELYDHALFQGELVIYLLTEGVVGLDVSSLFTQPTGAEEAGGAEGQAAALHVSGAGFYAGFQITWLDLYQRDPLVAPEFSYPTPADVLKFEFGFDEGVVFGFGGALYDAFWDVVSTLNPMTYVGLYDLFNKQLTDENWRFQVGRGLAEELHKYVEDFTDDSAFEIGYRFGEIAGFVVAQILLTWIGAKVATLAAGALRATKWGKPLIEFGERVADALPWHEPRIVESAEELPTVTPVTKPPEPLAAEQMPANVPSTLEARVGDSGELPNIRLSSGQVKDEMAFLREHPEIIRGEPPNRRAQIGEHEWQEGPDGMWCRHSNGKPLCVNSSEMKRPERAKGELEASDEDLEEETTEEMIEEPTTEETTTEEATIEDTATEEQLEEAKIVGKIFPGHEVRDWGKYVYAERKLGIAETPEGPEAWYIRTGKGGAPAPGEPGPGDPAPFHGFAKLQEINPYNKNPIPGNTQKWLIKPKGGRMGAGNEETFKFLSSLNTTGGLPTPDPIDVTAAADEIQDLQLLNSWLRDNGVEPGGGYTIGDEIVLETEEGLKHYILEQIP
jgi:hypothetical protein